MNILDLNILGELQMSFSHDSEYGEMQEDYSLVILGLIRWQYQGRNLKRICRLYQEMNIMKDS